MSPTCVDGRFVERSNDHEFSLYITSQATIINTKPCIDKVDLFLILVKAMAWPVGDNSARQDCSRFGNDQSC